MFLRDDADKGVDVPTSCSLKGQEPVVTGRRQDANEGEAPGVCRKGLLHSWTPTGSVNLLFEGAGLGGCLLARRRD